MAFGDDFSVNVAGDIRHVANTNHYTVLEMHRWLQDLADDPAASTSGNDLVDIASDTPSERITDQIINLLGTYNIDDDAAEYLYGGSITQGSGQTETVYSGLRVLGAVNNSSTQIEVVQDHALYDSPTPFWGTQSGGGYNGNAAAGILLRILVKSREFGRDIDSKKVRVQARHWGDSYDFFSVTLGTGEAVAAISTTSDAQNQTTQGTVTAWTHVLNSGGSSTAPTGGYQGIDLGNGNGTLYYYSKWTYGADPPGTKLQGVYEYLKDLTGNGTSRTCDGVNGELFLGITHWVPYTDEASGPFQEREIVFWGTDITYDSLTGGTFAVGDYVTFERAGIVVNGGKVLRDNGSTQMLVALEDQDTALADGDTITEADGVGGVTATIDTTIVDDGVVGGEGVLLALNDEGSVGDLWIQVIHGGAPVEDLPIEGRTSGATCEADTGITPATIPKMFLGSYTGTLIGAYGIGVDKDDLTSSDSVTPLVGATQTPPNNVTWTINELVSGEDYVLVGPKDGGANDFDKDFLTLQTTLNAPGQTSIVCTGSIPTDTPASGTVRVQLDVGTYRKVAYTSYTSATFTTASTDWSDPNDATAPRNIFPSYIDELASGTSAQFTGVYLAGRTLWVRVRDGGGTPIKTFETSAAWGSADSAINAIRTSDA